MKCIQILLVFLMLSSVSNWELRKDKDNIRIYTRKIIASDFKELKSITEVKTSLAPIIHILIDADHFTDWIYKCVKGSVVKKISDTEWITYQLFDAPFPFDDRDIVARCMITQDAKTKVVIVKSILADGWVPEKEGVVRIKNFHTHYTLTPEPNGFVKIDYELGTEPGGAVPAWLANLVMVNGPFTTQRAMNDLLQNPEIKKFRMDFINEP